MIVTQQDIDAAVLYLDGHPVHPGVELSVPGNIVEGMRELPSRGLAEWHVGRGYKLTAAGRAYAYGLKQKF